MRLPIATDLKTRTGAPDKDARLKNAYVEVKGNASAVRKRPCARGGLVVGSGTAQGGIGINIGGTDYIITVNGDDYNSYTMLDLASGGFIAWNSSTAYAVGDYVDYVDTTPDDPFETPPETVRYYAYAPNTNKNPTTETDFWSITPPPESRYTAAGEGYDGPPGYVSPPCASPRAAAAYWFTMLTKTFCPGPYPPQSLWLTDEGFYISGNYAYFSAHATTAGYPTCPGVPPGYLAAALITQVA